MRKINFAWIIPVVLIVLSNVVQADDISDLNDAVKKLQLEVAELKQPLGIMGLFPSLESALRG